MIKIECRSRWMTASRVRVSWRLALPISGTCKRPVSELFSPITDLLVIVAFIEAIVNVPT